jgi:putative hemolysin
LEPEGTWQIIILFVLLAFSAFYSASETALTALSKIRLRHLVDENVKGASLVNKLVENPTKLLGTILVGNNVVNIAASAIATSYAISVFGQAGVGIATAVMTILVLIFGEITPKSLAAHNSEKVSFRVSKLIYFNTIILGPIVRVLMVITRFFIRILGGNPDIHKTFITEEELKTIVNVSHEDGVLEVEEKKMIHNIVEFGDIQVKEIMRPRMDIIALDVESNYDEIYEVFKNERFSRIPIYEDSVDNIVGILNFKDLMFFEGDTKYYLVKDNMRTPYFTYEYKKTSELFSEMKKNNTHIAIVLDEYGGTAGLVTIEDLIEEIVGDINDEFDDGDEEIEVIKEDEYIVDGSTRIEDVNEMIGTHFESEDFDSIGGFVMGILGRLPEESEIIEFENVNFIIETVDKNRVDKIRIKTF